MTRTELKSAQRKAAFAARKTVFGTGLDPAANTRLLAEIGPAEGRIISGYMPIRTELSPLEAMTELAARNRICVPVIDGAGRPLRFREWRPGSAMTEGPFGARVPAEGAWLEPEILIAPLVAFDAGCNRLGYGGGFYDRTLEGLRAMRPTRAIGFAFDAQEMADLVLEPTDQLLDAVVTETRTLRPLVAPGATA